MCHGICRFVHRVRLCSDVGRMPSPAHRAGEVEPHALQLCLDQLPVELLWHHESVARWMPGMLWSNVRSMPQRACVRHRMSAAIRALTNPKPAASFHRERLLADQCR